MALKSSMKILLADEASGIRQTVKKMLSDLGFKSIVEAGDGEKALAIINESLEDRPIEFIIAEWDLPKLSGLELLKNVRSNNTISKTPFLMITSDADQQNVVIAVKAGVNNVIVKPFSAQTLIEKIDKIFNKGKK